MKIDEFSDFSTDLALDTQFSADSPALSLPPDDDGFVTTRSSSRSNKASTVSMKDTQKVFGGLKIAKKLPAVTCTAESSGSVPEATNDPATITDTPAAPLTATPASLPAQVPTIIPSAFFENPSLEAARIFESVCAQCPEVSSKLGILLEGLFDRIQSLEQALDSKQSTDNFAAAISLAPKRSYSTEFRKKLAATKTAPEKNKLLAESWESRGRTSKRLCADPTSDIHLANEDESFMVVHMAGFDLMRDEPRATISAVLSEKFGLSPLAIINVSPMAPKLQELHIITSKLPDLRAAIAKSNGALKLSTRLDARNPGVDSSDDNVIAASKARFCTRLDREINRLSSSPSRRLKDLADFLVAYKIDGTRQSAPRPRRSTVYASAFVDDAVFQTLEPSMVVQQC